MDNDVDTTWFPKAPSVTQRNFVGEIFCGRYRMVQKIDSGTMGVLYRAEQLSLQREVAVKILWQVDSREGSQRFQQEALCLAQLNNPYCVRIFDYGFDERQRVYFIVMELLRGCSVKEWVESKGPMSLPWAALLLHSASSALFALEQNDLIHRDIKPDNLFYTVDRRFQLIDFGLAMDLNSTVEEKFEGLLGTPMYMAPEQLHSGTLDHRSDIYSLGLSMLYVLTGEHPYKEKTVRSLLDAQQNHLPRIPSRLPLGGILCKMVDKNPNKRFQSASEILTALVEEVDHSVLEFLLQVNELRNDHG